MSVGRIVGLLLVLVGAVWTLQGLGVIGGGVMTGSTTWLVLGLALVVGGVVIVARRAPRG